MTSDADLAVELGSDEGGFLVTDAFPHDGRSFNLPANTLVQEVDQFEDEPPALMILAGSQWGPYVVTLRAESAMPETAEQWEDVVEVSVRCAGQLTVGEIVDGPVGSMPLQPGGYRMRINARGRTESDARDRSFEEQEDNAGALEHYLIELWPADPAPPAVVRETSRHALNTLDRSGPDSTLDGDAGLAAVWALLDDLRQTPGSRTRSGALIEVVVEATFPGTPTRVFNRVSHVFGWPPSMGAFGGGEEFGVGATTYHDATIPGDDQFFDTFGWIRTTVLEFDKPRHCAKSWNWLLPDDDRATLDTAPPLLERDAIVSVDLENIGTRGAEDATLVRLTHDGIPAEWSDHLKTLWTWDLTRLATRP